MMSQTGNTLQGVPIFHGRQCSAIESQAVKIFEGSDSVLLGFLFATDTRDSGAWIALAVRATSHSRKQIVLLSR